MQLEANESRRSRDIQQLEDEDMYNQIWAKIYGTLKTVAYSQWAVLQLCKAQTAHLNEVTAILAQVYESTTQWFTCWLIQTSVIEWSPLNGLNLYNRGRDKEGRLGLIGLGDEQTRPQGQRGRATAACARGTMTCLLTVQAIKTRNHNESQIGSSQSVLCREQLTVLPKFCHKFVSGLMQECGDVVVQRVHVLHEPLVRLVIHLRDIFSGC